MNSPIILADYETRHDFVSAECLVSIQGFSSGPAAPEPSSFALMSAAGLFLLSPARTSGEFQENNETSRSAGA
jgi:hypothetical protein